MNKSGDIAGHIKILKCNNDSRKHFEGAVWANAHVYVGSQRNAQPSFHCYEKLIKICQVLALHGQTLASWIIQSPNTVVIDAHIHIRMESVHVRFRLI